MPKGTKRKLTRNVYNRFYKKQKAADALIGRRINELTQIWVSAEKKFESEGGKVVLKTSPEAESAKEEFKEIKLENRFREDFPSFSKFMKFVRENKFNTRDLVG